MALPAHHRAMLDTVPVLIDRRPTGACNAMRCDAPRLQGFNSVRKHMKVDTRRWYHHADVLGLLVWQDIPAWSGNAGDFAAILAPEIADIYRGIRAAPSLMMVDAFNEGWGEGTPAMVNLTMELLRKASRGSHIMNDASGGRGLG